jgi:hypothetical protein
MVSKESYYSEKLYEATCQNDIDTIKYCLNNNADVNYINQDFGIAPLHVACMESKFDIIQLFIEHHANLLIEDNHGQTPIDMLNESLMEYHNKFPKCKYIFEKKYLKRCEEQNKILMFLKDFTTTKTTIEKIDMSIIYCCTDKNYCYVGIYAVSNHRYKDLWMKFGSCEWEIRSTSVGAAVDKIFSKSFDIIFESKENRLGNNDFKRSKKKKTFGEKTFIYPLRRYVATIEPGYSYIVRARYVHQDYNIQTNWSEWCSPIMYPKSTFVNWLRSYGLETFIGWLGKLNIYELKDLQKLDRQSLENGLKKSGMDFRERRLLWQGIQSSMKKKNKQQCCVNLTNGDIASINNKACHNDLKNGDGIDEEQKGNSYTPLYIFLKNLQLERYHDDIVLFVDTLEILLNAYSTQDELIEDIKEVIPEMKPAHRRILWKGIKKCLLCSDDRQNV